MKRSLELARMNLRVGVLSVAAFLLLVWVLFFPVRGVSPFGGRVRFVGYYGRVDGLRRSAPVFFRGTEVGAVEDVTIVPDRPDAPLKVVVSVRRDILPLLPKDLRMDIVAQGLLGDVFIDLAAGRLRRPGEPLLADGDVLATRPYASVLTGMNDLSSKVRTLLDQVNALLAQVRAGRGTAGQIAVNPQLYYRMSEALASLKAATDRIGTIEDTINTKLLDAKTKQAVDDAVASAQRALHGADELTAKAQALHWHLNLGMQKYAGQLYGAYFGMRIVPNNRRYYEGGVEYFNESLPFTAHDNTLGEGFIGYDAFLALRLGSSPVFFRGGIKRSSPDLGLDWRLYEQRSWLPFEVDFDAYHFGNPVPQLDVVVNYEFAHDFNLNLGVENMISGDPQFRAGLELMYDDEDFTTMLVKARTGL